MAKAKNEAKVKFSADTKEFDNGIKKANHTLADLRGEFKLNEAQMKTNGKSVEGLQEKQRILTAQMEASREKTQALSDKLAVAVEVFGENSEEARKLRNQLINAQTAEVKLQGAIQSCNRELQEHVEAQQDNRTAGEKLADSLEDQRRELDKLKDEYVDAALQYGENSDEAKSLAEEIKRLSKALKENQGRMDDLRESADDMDKSLEDTEDGFTVLKGACASLVADGISSVIGGIADLVSSFTELPAATREIRQDFATLTTAFQNVNFTTETATDTWKELYKVFGEDDRAVEAANNIARIAKDERDLAKWVKITTGVWGTYQDSLAVESLAEAAAETIRTGTVTGGLADALNWSSEASRLLAGYMGGDVVTAEDAMNAALSEVTGEEERQALITRILSKLYGEAADTYRDTTSAQMDAKEATAEQILAENNLADAIEPVTTAWQEMKNELLVGILPTIEKISGAMLDAMTWMKEHPVALKIIAGVLGVVAAALATLTIVTVAQTVAQWALNAAVLANPLTWIIVGIVAAIAAVVAIVIIMIEYWDEIVAAVGRAWQWVKDTLSAAGEWIYNNVIKPVADFFSGLWETVSTAFSTAWNAILNFFRSIPGWIDTNIIQPVVGFFSGCGESIKNTFVTVWTAVKDFFISVWEGIKQTPIFQFFSELFTSIYNTIASIISVVVEIVKGCWEIIKQVWSIVSTWFDENVIQPVVGFFTGLWNGIKDGVTAAWDWIKGVFETVATWYYENVVEPVTSFFTGLWDGIKNAASSAWDGIKGVWTTVSTWYNEKIVQPVTGFFSRMWNGLKDGAKNAWEGIKSVFSKVTSWFGDIFGKAWEKVKNVFSAGGKIFSGIKDGIANAFKKVVNAIIKGINKVVSVPFNAINKVLNKIRSAEIVGIQPFKNLGSVSVPQIPLLAEGGILDQATLNIAGEAGPEAIIPIDKLQSYISTAMDRTMQAVNINALVAAIEDLASRPIELNVNGRKFAVATAADADVVNGNRLALSKRGLAL